MRNSFFRAAACGSHMCRLVASELEKISQGACSGPLISQLKVMPLALTFISTLHFLEGFAKRMRRIDAEDRQLLGEERKLLQREHEAAVVGVALDIGIELRGEEVALDHVAFE